MSTTTTTPAPSGFSAEWAKIVSFFTAAEGDIGSFLTDVATGAEIVIEDIESVGEYVAAHLGIITSTIATVGTLANTVAPNNVSVQKVMADLQTGANDVAALSNSLTSGASANDPAVVTTAVTAINAVKTLSGLASQAGATLSQLAGATPAATQSVSPPTPNQG